MFDFLKKYINNVQHQSGTTLGPDGIITSEVEESINVSITLLHKKYGPIICKELKSIFTESIRNGWGLRELEKAISKIPNIGDISTARQIAHNETFRIANFAGLLSWKNTGVVKTVKIFSVGDELTCPACKAWHNKVILINSAVVGKTAPPYPFCKSKGGCRCDIRPEKMSID